MRIFQTTFFLILFLLISCSETSKETHKYTNALINESSPYLLQHAHNPVHWQPWSEKILAKAKKENKLILFSIGYASCHWCHVMEKETFENAEVAKFMNTHFINVKVDREEHPDIDKTYIKAVQLMTGNSGWPLNCITLPNGEPVWGGTYFTKENWMNSLKQIVKIHQENPEKTAEFAKAQTERIKSLQTFAGNNETLSNISTDSIIISWKKLLDIDAGGLQESEKFPRPSNYNFLLRYATVEKNTELLNHVNTTLTNIANRGLFDHLEGGFARYATDELWNIPHFEKMLYDNAQLISLFSDAYQTQKNNRYKEVVYQTLDFIQKQFSREDGLLYASLNADSFNEKNELEEGAYYVWKIAELQKLIKDDFTLFAEYYGINKVPKTEDGKHVLVKTSTDDTAFAGKNNVTLADLRQKVAQWKTILLQERKLRKAPEIDTKVITAWNALMLKAYTDAYKVFGDETLKTKAINTATAIKEKLITADGKVLRSLENKGIDGYLEDYAFLIDAFLAVYQITFDAQWLNDANSLTEYTINHFYDAEKELFAFSELTAGGLTFKEFDVEDGVMPSANSVMSHNLFQLSHYFGNEDFALKSEKMLQRVLPDAIKFPYLHANWLELYLNLSEPYYEVVINGKDAIAKAKELWQNYLPNIILCGSTSESELPLLKNRFYEDKTYIYVCVNRACKLPTEKVEKAISLMK